MPPTPGRPLLLYLSVSDIALGCMLAQLDDSGNERAIYYLSKRMLEYECHTPNPDPTQLADPNRFPGRETQDWDSLPDFFFTSQLAPVGMAHTYKNSKYYIRM